MKLTRLNQILAALTAHQKSYKDGLTEAHHIKAGDVLGHEGRYTPSDDEGETLPNESSLVKSSIPEVIERVVGLAEPYINAAAARDYSNMSAVADVVLDGQVLVAKAPVTYLLYLDNVLTDLTTWVQGLPTLDPGENWTWDSQVQVYKGREVSSQKTVSEKTPLVLYPATDKHPAQVQVVDRPRVVGVWRRTKFSAGIPLTEKRALLERLGKVQQAVRLAREEANMIEAQTPSVARPLLDFIFSPSRDPRT